MSISQKFEQFAGENLEKLIILSWDWHPTARLVHVEQARSKLQRRTSDIETSLHEKTLEKLFTIIDERQKVLATSMCSLVPQGLKIAISAWKAIIKFTL